MDFKDLMANRKLVVGDGAMGSQLIARGLPAGTPGELWNLERPETIEQIHRGYVQAGADYVLTNTFGGNALVLARGGLTDRLAEINEAAVRIARRAAGERAAVLGDIGSTGELLQPLGTLTEEEALDAFGAQARALAAGGVDAFIIETFDSSAEARLALQAANRAADIPLILSMKFNPEKSGRFRNVMGEGPAVLTELVEECRVDVVGTNCGQGIATMVELVGEISELIDLPIIAQPNAGRPELVKGETVYREDADHFARHLPDLYDAGAKIIGGCCGTTEEHIRRLRQFADSLP